MLVGREPTLGFLEERFAPLADTLPKKPPPVSGEAEEVVEIESHFGKVTSSESGVRSVFEATPASALRTPVYQMASSFFKMLSRISLVSG